MYQRIILLILFPLFGFSQAPQKINFQSILRNSSGEVVANKLVSLKISILSSSISGSIVYTETHTKTTDPSGLISLQIGAGTVLSGVFANIGWGDFPHFIKLEADFSGGSNYVLLGTQELMSVPYALYASKTDTSSLNLTNRFSSKVNIADTSSMLNPYLRKADAIVSVETDPVFNSSVAKGITGIDTAYWNRKTGNTAGSIQYWNGNSWVNLTPGRNGQTLQLINGLPSWSGPDYASLTTSIASFITINSAVVGGNISSDGGASISSRGIVYGTLPNPTLTNTVLNLGSGTGIFSGPLIGLTPNTTFYFRSYATNITGTVYGNEVTFTTLQGVTDIEGNTYNTIQIGSQLWMMENLKTTKYRGGESIPNVVADLDWQSLTTGAWVHYDHGFTYNAVYGKLYNWYSTKGDSICPINWHVPTDLDWILLFNNLNGNSVAGGKMKSVGTSYWNSPNIGATNESGFSGLPGGFRDNYGFQDFGDSTAFWSSTESDTNHAFIIALDSYSKAGIGPNNRLKTVGNSIRCLKN